MHQMFRRRIDMPRHLELVCGSSVALRSPLFLQFSSSYRHIRNTYDKRETISSTASILLGKYLFFSHSKFSECMDSLVMLSGLGVIVQLLVKS